MNQQAALGKLESSLLKYIDAVVCGGLAVCSVDSRGNHSNSVMQFEASDWLKNTVLINKVFLMD